MVYQSCCQRSAAARREIRRAGIMAALVCLSLACGAVCFAQGQGVHYVHQGIMPPGAIGGRQLQRGGPLPGFFQPVEIKAPSGALVSLAEDGRFGQPQSAPRCVGLLIGQVYRLRVVNIPLNDDLELFPTIEIIDRLYAPADQALRFPIPIELSTEDLLLAARGQFVTRVIYLENPRDAFPERDDPNAQRMIDVGANRDPLADADALGRPVAILRIGGRMPLENGQFDAAFLFGCPPYQCFSAANKTVVKRDSKIDDAKTSAPRTATPDAIPDPPLTIKPAAPNKIKQLPPPPE
jgi:hypothetical protein